MNDLLSERQLARVNSYCAELCPDDRVDEAVSASLIDLRARVDDAGAADELEALVAKAARSGAATHVKVGAGHPSPPTPECEAMPELLAARANDELPGDDRVIRQHLNECIVCETTFARFRRAEQYLAAPAAVAVAGPAVGEDVAPGPVAPEPEPELVAEPEPTPEEPEPEPVAEELERPEPPEPPEPPSEPPAPSPIVVKQRRGGLVAAIGKVARNAMR